MTENIQPESPRENTFIADAGLARRLTRAFFRRTLFSKPTIILGVGLLAIAAFLAFAIQDSVGRTAVILVTVILIMAVVGMFRGQFKAVLAQFQLSAPDGGVLGVKIMDDTLEFVSPLGSSQSSYAAYESISVQDDVVLLKQRASTIVYLSPIELFPGDSVEFIAARIQNSAPEALPKSV